ncbi:MAG: hypothetical protein AAF471_07200 [Myxococcota bacterium]
MYQLELPTQRFATFLGLIKGLPQEREVHNLIGFTGAEILSEHFNEKNQKPNKVGGPKSNFWAQAADQTDYALDPIRIYTTKIGVAQRVYGGIITAKKAKNLVFPVHPISYNIPARDFTARTGIALYPNKKRTVILGRVGGQSVILYVIKRSVKQEPDPSAIPTGQTFENGILAELAAYINQQQTAA